MTAYAAPRAHQCNPSRGFILQRTSQRGVPPGFRNHRRIHPSIYLIRLPRILHSSSIVFASVAKSEREGIDPKQKLLPRPLRPTTTHPIHLSPFSPCTRISHQLSSLPSPPPPLLLWLSLLQLTRPRERMQDRETRSFVAKFTGAKEARTVDRSRDE